jgi:hypothetical protein
MQKGENLVRDRSSVNLKTRDDDRRGGSRHGSHGQQPFVPTPKQRAEVRALVKTVTTKGNSGLIHVARHMGLSISTLERHFSEEIALGRAELQITCGTIMIRAATDAEYAATVSREQMDAVRFVLTRQGGWSSKVEVSGPGGGPIPLAQFDISALIEAKTEDELLLLLPGLDAVTTLIANSGPEPFAGGGAGDEGPDFEEDL